VSDAVLVAVISANAVVLSAIIPAIFSTRRHVKNTANQTSNGHTTLMRDDIDVLIVAQHRMHEALGIEDSFVRNRYEHIRQRQKERSP
jgi:hypothetical protein